MRIEVEHSCKSCGARYVPTMPDLLKVPAVYRLCPECREPKDEDAIDEPAAA